ncbi:MAG: putative RecB family exonuclease [Pseudonocardiales bacterium]|jgi:putative RecB family exonuclease|nr:putative RecB family exonuclease [Pseudonocardiales bacterium]
MSRELSVPAPTLVTMTESQQLPEAVIGSLSPSRAADFKTCPLLYRFRCIDRLPQAPSRVAARGTVVHAVLESLFDLPAAERTLATAKAMVPDAWARVLADEPESSALFADDTDGAELAGWLEGAADLVENYFRLEDPSRLEPAAREELVEIVIDGLRLRGYVDRLDVSPAGDIRVVDYKTGTTPREAFEAKALFQMKFYALVLWRTRGIVPRQLRLMYLSDVDTLSYQPDATELERFERTLRAIWAAIQRATLTGDFRPSPSKLCNWCDHQALCPAFGGTPPPFPADALASIDVDRRVAAGSAPG